MGRGGATASRPHSRPADAGGYRAGDYGEYAPVKTGARWVTEGTIGKGAYGVVWCAPGSARVPGRWRWQQLGPRGVSRLDERRPCLSGLFDARGGGAVAGLRARGR